LSFFIITFVKFIQKSRQMKTKLRIAFFAILQCVKHFALFLLVIMATLAASAQSVSTVSKTVKSPQLWQLLPATTVTVSPTPALRSAPIVTHHHGDDDEKPPVAVNIRATAALFSALKKGSELILPIPGENLRVRANLVVDETGGRFIGGVSTTKKGDSFSFMLDADGKLSGFILRESIERAFILEHVSATEATLQDVPLGDVICWHFTPPKRPEGSSSDALRSTASDPVPILNSRPEAVGVIYLDFDGEIVSGGWSSAYNSGSPIIAQPATVATTDDHFRTVWKQIAEDYSPFDVNVTTDLAVYLAAPLNKRTQCIFTPTWDWYPFHVGGVAIVGSFSNDYGNLPCWVFTNNLGSIKALAEAASHEVGHTFGLHHDGLIAHDAVAADDYFTGHGTSPANWAPIMGVGSYVNIVQWSKGEYKYANNNDDDDVAIIAGVLDNISANDGGYIPKTDGLSMASPFTLRVGTVSKSGIIRQQGETDYYKLVLSAPADLTLTANPDPTAPNLDIVLSLLNNVGGVIATDNPETGTTVAQIFSASLTQSLTAGTYYISVKGTGLGDPLTNGYSDYASIGQYTLSGNITSAVFVPVTDITGVPTTTRGGTGLALTGTVAPTDATNQTIAWSVFDAGTTGATISGSTLNTTAAGTVTVRATVTNGLTASTDYTQDFIVTVSAPFVRVSDIIDVPTSATMGTDLALTGTVVPTTATNQTIVWSLGEDDDAYTATINGNTLNVTVADFGMVTVRATIINGWNDSTDYMQYFLIWVNTTFVQVSDITGVPTTATAGTGLTLTGTVAPTDATNQTIAWSVVSAGTTGATISGSTLNTTAAGTVTVRATVTNGLPASQNYTMNFIITVNAFVPVTNITGVPTTATVGTGLALTGTVAPTDATNQTIAWSVVSAGTTGATISGNTLNATATGTVTVRATITNGLTASNYTKDFIITVSAAFVPVTNITGVPTSATAGTGLTLTGTVAPTTATNQTIAWSVVSAGTTGATISGSTLNTTAAGSVTVRATITNGLNASDYTKDFNITVYPTTPTLTPVINSANSTTFTVITAGSFTVTATNSPTSFAIGGDPLPTGLSFNTTTGKLNGTPAIGTNGTYNLTFSATNAGGTSTQQNFILTVNKLNQTQPQFVDHTVIQKIYGDETFDLPTILGGQGTGVLSYHSDNSYVAIVDDSGRITITGAGSAVIYVKKLGDANYTDSAEDYIWVNVAKANYTNITHNLLAIVFTETNTLADVEGLQAGFSWINPDEKLKIGTSSHAARYNADPNNYNDFLLNITVNVTDVLYKIAVAETVNGTVTPSFGAAPEGMEVFMNVTPAEDYEFDDFKIYQTGNERQTIRVMGDGYSRTFYMPAYDVTIAATFKPTVVTDIADNVETGHAPSLHAVSTENGLRIKGLVPNDVFSIYNMQGQLVYRGKAITTEQTVNLRGRGIYIVTTGGRQIKVVY
jgi:hypothetical protein